MGISLISLGLAAGICAAAGAAPKAGAAPNAAIAPPAYRAIAPSQERLTVVLTGQDLTIDQVVQVARFGAKVTLSDAARERSSDAYGLLLEAAAEGVPVYWFNRGSGSNRQKYIFTGDPESPQNRRLLETRQLALFRRGALSGLGPEIDSEEIVRAMLVVRANTMSFEAASPQLTQRLLDLLNDRITPVVQSRGTVGEGDLGPFANVGATMVGAGMAYYRGTLMSAAQALAHAGLGPLAPFAADDSELESTNAYATALAALVLHDAREALSWADLTYAIDLNGMNSSVSPLARPVQNNRPFKWLNWHAARVLDMLRGSYLFDLDDKRIIQDPESLRASSIRQGSAWQAWARLRDDVRLQMNSSDHNPAVRVGASPTDSWELATPQLAQFYVKGGPHSKGKHGFIFSNANWDPYPMANDLEAFTIAVANMDAAIAQRIVRFTNPFFTVISSATARGDDETAPGFAPPGSEFDTAALMQEIQGFINPVPPEGNALIQTVEDLQSQTRLKLQRARAITEDTIDLVAEDLLTGSHWLDLRKSQNPAAVFGGAPTAVWSAFRSVLPYREDTANPRTRPAQEIAAEFIRGHSARTFFPEDEREPVAADFKQIAGDAY